MSATDPRDGSIVTTAPPRSALEVIHAHSSRKADFLLDCPGLSQGVNDLIVGVMRFARAHGVRPEEITMRDGRVTPEGEFIIKIDRHPGRTIRHRQNRY